jgi:flagellar biosynthetic protein FliQ
MNEAWLMTFAQNALLVTLLIAGPVLLVTLIIGSIISLIQAATQVNEYTLTFVPKLIGAIVVLLLLGSWMGQKILTFTENVYTSLPNLVR